MSLYMFLDYVISLLQVFYRHHVSLNLHASVYVTIYVHHQLLMFEIISEDVSNNE